ncbi:hypothetical protein BWI96_07885 [Siphonobacter sp. SORGH_AS_0500]|nr:hypothetical protein BWI96_07885 [Siphonobacter sp. SORGH_AS_0500]
MKKQYLLLLFFICKLIAVSYAQDTLLVSNKFTNADLIPVTFFSEDSLGGSWKKIPGENMGSRKEPVYFQSFLKNTGSHPITLMFVTKGIDFLEGYIQGSRLQFLPQIGTVQPLCKRIYPTNFLIYTFTLEPGKTNRLFLRVKENNYKLSLSPFYLFEKTVGQEFISKQTLYQHLYVGGMMLMLCFGIALMLLFRSRLYFLYSACVSTSLMVMLMQNEYYYYWTSAIPEIVYNKDVFGILVVSIAICYFFFTKEFLKINKPSDQFWLKIGYVLIAILLILLITTYIADLRLFELRAVFYPFLDGLFLVTLLFAVKSFRRKYKPAWLFAFATVPVIVIGFIESLSNWHQIASSQLFNAYYMGTLWEMFLLTLGIAYRFYLDQLQLLRVKETQYRVEMQTRHEERERMARDLHDKMGALLSAIRLNVGLLKKMSSENMKDVFDQTDQMLLLASEECRNIAHNIYPAALLQLGLLEMITEMYGQIESPKFTIHSEGFEKDRLETVMEVTLYSIIQETINNIFKHAEAKEVTIQLTWYKKQINLIIEDDGRGFEPSLVKKRGMGLQSMKRRVAIMNGKMEIDSKPGRGTIILVKINYSAGRTSRFLS